MSLVGWAVFVDRFFRHESQGERYEFPATSSELRDQGNSPAYLCGLVSVSQTKRNETGGIKTHWKFAYENEIQIGFPCPSQSVPASPIAQNSERKLSLFLRRLSPLFMIHNNAKRYISKYLIFGVYLLRQLPVLI